MKNDFKIIGFDADDTLWMNESYFRETEEIFYNLLSGYSSKEIISGELLNREVQNLNLYGYSAKGFILSMIETALDISDNKIPQSSISEIIQLGKDLINKPLVLLDGVQDTLEYLYGKGIKLILVTKGDLLDQQRKLKNSCLDNYFHHIEIMSDKKDDDYRKLLSHLRIEPEDFLMIGNSLKSDIIPVLNIGGFGIHIPFHTTWKHEVSGKIIENKAFKELGRISDIKKLL